MSQEMSQEMLLEMSKRSRSQRNGDEVSSSTIQEECYRNSARTSDFFIDAPLGGINHLFLPPCPSHGRAARKQPPASPRLWIDTIAKCSEPECRPDPGPLSLHLPTLKLLELTSYPQPWPNPVLERLKTCPERKPTTDKRAGISSVQDLHTTAAQISKLENAATYELAAPVPHQPQPSSHPIPFNPVKFAQIPSHYTFSFKQIPEELRTTILECAKLPPIPLFSPINFDEMFSSAQRRVVDCM